jgi:hypothetical protein
MPHCPRNYNCCAFLHYLITNRHLLSPSKIINSLFGANFALSPAQNVLKYDQTMSEGAASSAKYSPKNSPPPPLFSLFFLPFLRQGA